MNMKIINNNWYTNYIARWCILYALKTDNELGKNHGSLISKEEESNDKTFLKICTYLKLIIQIYFYKMMAF